MKSTLFLLLLVFMDRVPEAASKSKVTHIHSCICRRSFVVSALTFKPLLRFEPHFVAGVGVWAPHFPITIC